MTRYEIRVKIDEVKEQLNTVKSSNIPNKDVKIAELTAELSRLDDLLLSTPSYGI